MRVSLNTRVIKHPVISDSRSIPASGLSPLALVLLAALGCAAGSGGTATEFSPAATSSAAPATRPGEPAATVSPHLAPVTPAAPQPAGSPVMTGEAALTPDQQKDTATVGDLLVAPTRIILEGSRRSAEVTLVNIGPTAATYRVSLTHLRMTEKGELQEITEVKPEDRIADPLVRFSPRQVTLEPNLAQTIRIQLRKPADLAVGEYRSHLLFRAVPPAEKTSGNVESQNQETEGIVIRLTPIYGISIPLIVRHGKTSVSSTLSDVQLVPASAPNEAPVVSVRVNRTGNQTIYGDLKVRFLPASGGEEKVVGLIGGIAVYSPLPYREVQVPLQFDDGQGMRKGRLRVTYTEEGLRGGLLAGAELTIP